MADNTVEVKVSKKVYDEIEKRIKSGDLQFESVEAFVQFALADILDIEEDEKLSPADEEAVSKRLTAFGY